jgi:hypothetical protein
MKEEASMVEKQDLTVPQRENRCSQVAPNPRILGEAGDDCLPPTALLTRFGSFILYFVPDVEIHSERSPFSDDR